MITPPFLSIGQNNKILIFMAMKPAHQLLRFCSCFFLLCTAIAVNAQNASKTVPPLIPLPAQSVFANGSFALTGPVLVQAPPADSLRPVVEALTRKIETATGFAVQVSATAPQAAIRLALLKKETALGREGYKLTVDASGVQLSANTAAGLFYGLQTLWQLMPAAIESKTKVADATWPVAYASIADMPRFGYRGLMLDVVRHWFTKQQVKDYIDEMVKYKYNFLHLHLTDDQGWRIEIKSHPRLTEIGGKRPERTGMWGSFKGPDSTEARTYGGYYTQDDIRDIIAYAKDRFVTILPEIDIPGHSMAILAAYPELACTPGKYDVNVGNRFMIWPDNGRFYGLVDNNLCPANEKVYEVLDQVFGEIAQLFPYEYIHMGGDETYKGFWEKSDAIKALMVKEKLKSMDEVQSYFVKRVSKIISSKGKKMIGWDEILEGGIAPGAVVMSWRGEKGGIEAAKMKHHVIMSPSTFTYVDLYQGDPLAEPPTYGMVRLKKSYEFNPVPAGVDSAYVIGGQANLWSERLHTIRHMQYMLWPRGWAVAEANWSPVRLKNWNQFIDRTEAHFKRADQAEVNYSTSLYDPIVDVKKLTDSTIQVSLSTEVPGIDIHYSFDEFYPDAYYPVYNQPLVFPAGASTLKVVTYRKKEKVGKSINLPLNELKKRVKMN